MEQSLRIGVDELFRQDDPWPKMTNIKRKIDEETNEKIKKLVRQLTVEVLNNIDFSSRSANEVNNALNAVENLTNISKEEVETKMDEITNSIGQTNEKVKKMLYILRKMLKNLFI